MAENIVSAETTAAEGAVEVGEDADSDDGSISADFTGTGGGNDSNTEKVVSETVPGKSAENAKRRREQERARELEAARVAAIIEAVGENPFTGEPIKDADDVAEYLAMREIQKQGKDPLADYHTYQKEKAKKARTDEENARKQDEWFAADKEAFGKAHPDVDIRKLISDEHFIEYAQGKLGVFPLAEIYDGYSKLKQSFRKEADESAARAIANSKASPGALSGTTGSPEKEFFTAEEVRSMSREEVKANYDKIMKSMKKWTGG